MKQIIIFLLSSAFAFLASAKEHTINIEGFAFPKEVKIQVGDTIKWTNNSPSFHTISDDPAVLTGLGVALEQAEADTLAPTGFERFNRELPVGEEFTVTFDEAGEYNYFCQPHYFMDMKGSIIVE